jgi:hypothetical protein
MPAFTKHVPAPAGLTGSTAAGAVAHTAQRLDPRLPDRKDPQKTTETVTKMRTQGSSITAQGAAKPHKRVQLAAASLINVLATDKASYSAFFQQGAARRIARGVVADTRPRHHAIDRHRLSAAGVSVTTQRARVN